MLEAVDLSAIVEDTCGTVRRIAEEKELTIRVKTLASIPGAVFGDVASLRRLLWILLDNAVKYTSAPGQIDVSVETAPGQAVLHVADSGIGISATDLPHIFDRFYRADPSRSDVEGSGLGLSIARWIAEAHHAEITVTSERNRGTSIRVAFPLA